MLAEEGRAVGAAAHRLHGRLRARRFGGAGGPAGRKLGLRRMDGRAAGRLRHPGQGAVWQPGAVCRPGGAPRLPTLRGQGIGRALFRLACREARALGAERLYISAHSARETIAAYRAFGCVEAEEINWTLAKKEPCDVQLEYVLEGGGAGGIG